MRTVPTKPQVEECVNELTQAPEKLLSAIRSNDYLAFETAHIQWQKPILNFITKLTNSRAEAKDLAQDVFLDLWENRATIELDRDLKSLIFAMARNKATSKYRQKSRENSYLENMEFDDVDLNNSHEIMVGKECEVMLKVILHRMPKHRREVFLLSVEQGMTAEQIAKHLGVKRETVYVQLSVARREVHEGLVVLILMMIW